MQMDNLAVADKQRSRLQKVIGGYVLYHGRYISIGKRKANI